MGVLNKYSKCWGEGSDLNLKNLHSIRVTNINKQMVKYVAWPKMKSSVEKNEPGQRDRTCWVANLGWGWALLFFYTGFWDDLIDWMTFEERTLGTEERNCAHIQEKSFSRQNTSWDCRPSRLGVPQKGPVRRTASLITISPPYPQMPHPRIQRTASEYCSESAVGWICEFRTRGYKWGTWALADFGVQGGPATSTPRIPRDDYTSLGQVLIQHHQKGTEPD